MKSLTLTLLLFVSSSVYALPVLNGDFSSGLDSWDAFGDVSEESGEAKFTDDFDGFGSLSQLVELGTGTAFELSFEISLRLSDFIPQGDPFATEDFFFASLFLTDDASFDGTSIGFADEEYELLFAQGSFVDVVNGTLTHSALSFGLDLFDFSFMTTKQYAFLAFDFIDGNLEIDSTVLLDNVSIEGVNQEIPEPATALLSLAGLAAVRRFRKNLN